MGCWLLEETVCSGREASAVPPQPTTRAAHSRTSVVHAPPLETITNWLAHRGTSMRSAPKGKPSEQFVAGRRIAQLLKQEVGPHPCASNIGWSSTIGGLPRRFLSPALPRRSRATRSAVTCAIPHWPMLGGSSVRNMRVPGPVPGWDARINGRGNVLSSVQPVGARDEGLEGLSQATVCCVSSHSDGTVRGTMSHMSLDTSSVFLDGVTHGIQMRKSAMDGGWRTDGGERKSRFCRSSLSSLEGSAPSGEARVREQGIRTKTSVCQLDGQMQRRPEVGASPCSLSALAAFFKLIETRLALDQPATRFTSWFRVRDGGLALFARRHIVKPHARRAVLCQPLCSNLDLLIRERPRVAPQPDPQRWIDRGMKTLFVFGPVGLRAAS